MNKGVHKTLNWFARILNILTLVGCLLILASLSYEIIYSNQFYITEFFIQLQLVVCIIFLVDFMVRFALSERKGHFVLYNWVLLLVSVPVLSILNWYSMDVSNQWYLIFRIAPILRGIYGLVIVVRWVTRNGIVSLMVSYLVTVVVFTYCGSLVFFSVEHHVNPAVTDFGQALMWACMNVTTIGANLFAVTPIGKVLTIMMAAIGMMMFPIFTAFIINRFKDSYSSKRTKRTT